MCGRYAASANPDALAEEFELVEIDESGREACLPSFNIAPTHLVPAVVERLAGEEVVRKLVGLRWGLVPSWSKDATGAARLINARLETVATKPSFRKAFASRRCILPALGYYEWRQETQAGAKVRQPYFIAAASTIMAMAGLYEFWKGPDGWLSTTTIITTKATDALGWVHERMPVQINKDNRDAWLDPSLTDPDAALALLGVPSTEALLVRPVSRAVNRVSNNGPALLAEYSGASPR